MEKTYTLDLTEKEIEALVNLMDAGVRQQGLNGAPNAAFLLQKINAAMAPQKNTVQGDEE